MEINSHKTWQSLKIAPLIAMLLAGSAVASPSTDALIRRILPQKASHFRTEKLEKADNKEVFRISATDDGKVLLQGSSLSAETAAFGWYIKHVAKGHLSWSGDQIPETFPLPKEPITITTPYRFRFAHNYCTLSYTAAFWGWERWERELDFMATNGFNRQLVTAGLEKVWQLTLRELNYPEDRINSYIAAPAYSPWWNMGNLQGEGGPISQDLIDSEAALGKKIFQRCRDLGSVPVLQGFVGLLPSDISNYNKDLGRLIPQGRWCVYERQVAMDPGSPEFQKVATIWYKHLHAIYGDTAEAYACDLFHEGGNHGNVDLTAAARSVQSAMQTAAPGAQWVIMGWQNNPVPPLVAGTFDDDRTLILQLCRNMNDGDNGGAIRTYQGRPWVWGELLNFGGNHGLYGGIPLMTRLPSFLLDPQNNRGNLAGVGLLSEGIETNPYYYDLFFDVTWRHKNVDLRAWLPDFLERRHGKSTPNTLKAYELLTRSVYSPTRIQEGTIESILCAKPGLELKKASTWSPSEVHYELADVLAAANELSKASNELGKSPTYRYDLTDVIRQVLSDLARPVLSAANEAFLEGDAPAFKKHAEAYLELIEDTDKLLAADPNWLLGTWLAQAKSKAHSPADKAQMEVHARRLITTWNSQIDLLDEYSHRQWAGLMRDYYLPRWQSYFDACENVLSGNKPAASLNNWYASERAKTDLSFATSTKAYPVSATGDTLTIAKQLLDKYNPIAETYHRYAKTTKGLAWSLHSEKQTFTFDVNDMVMTKGNYEITLQWQQGQSALKIHRVELYEGDQKVAEDIHEGWTGQKNENNTYLINLPKFRTDLDSYTLRVKVSAASSIDSQGVMKIRRAK